MDTEEALKFLEAHQPLPDDKQITQELLDKYDEVMKYFIEYPDPRCIPLFLGSFGDKDGFGVYQVVDDVFYKYERKVVVPQLSQFINSQFLGVKYNATDLALHFSDKVLIEPLSRNLDDPDNDVRSAAVLALQYIPCDESVKFLKKRLKIEEDDSVRESIIEALNYLAEQSHK